MREERERRGFLFLSYARLGRGSGAPFRSQRVVCVCVYVCGR